MISCTYANIEDIVIKTKSVPHEQINASGNDIAQELIDYIRPLIQGNCAITSKNRLPVYAVIPHLK